MGFGGLMAVSRMFSFMFIRILCGPLVVPIVHNGPVNKGLKCHQVHFLSSGHSVHMGF